MRKVDQQTRFFDEETQNIRGRELLEEAQTLFDDRRRFLIDRERAARYRFGDQWSDQIEDPDTGEVITEEQYIRNDGRTPIINNLIGKTVRNLVGQLRTNYGDPIVFSRTREKARAGERMTNALQAALDKNEVAELDAREFEEFMISAGFGWKTTYKFWSPLDHEDLYIETIDQTRFFHNIDAKDIRNHDVEGVGELHDLTIDEVLKAFAVKPGDEERLRKMFPYVPDHEYYDRLPDFMQKFRDFYIPDNLNKVRVIEYWKKEYGWQEFAHDVANADFQRITPDYFANKGLPNELIQNYSNEELINIINRDRIERATALGVDPNSVELIEYDSRYEEMWRVYYLSPYGDILAEMDTPYDHQEHPYTFGFYPLMDGRTRSLVSSILDQQRFVNRMIQMLDLGMSKSIKNLMWIPADMVPEGMNRQEFADQAVTYNGIMYYEPKQGVPPPQPIKTNAQVAGQTEMLSIMMDMIENISSVNDAVQGMDPGSNTPASLYAQRTSNALVSNKDYFDFFFAVMRRRNRKAVQVIKQFYREQRYIRVAGSGSSKGIEDTYDPDAVQGIDFDVVLGEAQDTLAYRQLTEQSLKEYLMAGFITFEQYLQNSSEPFADQLLQSINNEKEKMMEGGMTPEMLQQMQAQIQGQGGQQQLPVDGQAQ